MFEFVNNIHCFLLLVLKNSKLLRKKFESNLVIFSDCYLFQFLLLLIKFLFLSHHSFWVIIIILELLLQSFGNQFLYFSLNPMIDKAISYIFEELHDEIVIFFLLGILVLNDKVRHGLEYKELPVDHKFLLEFVNKFFE